MTFLTQHLGLSIFDPNLGWNNPAFFRVQPQYLHNKNEKKKTVQPYCFTHKQPFVTVL